MTTITHSARITRPVSYATSGGRKSNIPVGPCLIEQIDDRLVNIIWGARGQSSTESMGDDEGRASFQQDFECFLQS